MLSLRTLGIAARNVIIGGNLAAVAMVRRPRDLVAYVTESLFLRGTILGRQLPVGDLSEFGAGPTDLTMQPMADWFHNIPTHTQDMLGLAVIARRHAPKVVFEIGTLSGVSAMHLALNTPDGARIHTLDLAEAPSLATTDLDRVHMGLKAMVFAETPVESKIERLFGDSARFDFTPYLGIVDLFFIDGAHSYEYVRSDTLNALRCCHPGSVIVWHDYGRVGTNGVSRWLHEFARRAPGTVRCLPGGSLAYLRVEG